MKHCGYPGDRFNGARQVGGSMDFHGLVSGQPIHDIEEKVVLNMRSDIVAFAL
ncbi:hypothetical protein D3C73_1577610 [compost metagenome]